MADTYTTNLNLTKPEPGAAEDTWGISLNADLDSLDAIFSTSGTQINLNPNQINFADGKKLILGTGSDLEIYHDGSNSYIKDTGTGTLRIQGSSSILMQKLDGEIMMIAREDGAVELNHNGSQKIKTTSTGVNVTGTVNTDSLTVTGDIEQTTGDLKYTGGINWDIAHHGASQNIVFKTTPSGGSATEVMRIRHDGNIGIGTASPSNPLTVLGADSMAIDDYIVHYGDSNTKIGFPSNDKFKIRVAGSDIATVTSTGLGIGTSSPQGNLHVEGAAGVSGGGIIYVTDADNGSTASDALQISKSGDTAFIYNRETSGNLQLGAGGNANHMIVRTDGKVGIGTTSPGEKLSVSGGIIRVQNGSNTTFYEEDKIHSYAANGYVIDGREGLILETSTADTDIILSPTGNVGIGTTSPSANLHVLSSGNGEIEIERASGALINLQAQSARGVIGTDTNHELQLKTNGSGRMTINTAGNVGIGTSSPSAALDVGGQHLLQDNYDATGAVFRRNGTYGSVISLGRQGVGDGATLDYPADNTLAFSLNGSERARLNSTGLGIGTTSPQELLHLEATEPLIRFDDTNSGLHYILGQDGDGFKFTTNNSTYGKYTFDSSVGIGTDSPQRQLHIVGSNVAAGIRLEADTAADATLELLAFDGNNTASIKTLGGNDALVLGTAGSERARFDSSGNFLCGTTNTTPAFGTGNGTAIRTGEMSHISRSGGTPLALNRASSDGDILSLRKDGSQVGSIGTTGGLYIASAGCGLRLHNTGTKMFPTNSAGSPADGTVDLGAVGGRFKDLHLSGAAYTGGQLKGSAGSTTKTIINATSTTTELHAAGTTGTVFKNNGDAEKARLDGNGNFLVGKTGAGTNTAGAQIDSTGRANFTVDANFGLLVNRKTSDGEIARFQKDGTTVGSINALSGDLAIGTGDTGVRFHDGTNSLFPVNTTTNANVDDSINIGHSTARFQNLHLSNAVKNESGALAVSSGGGGQLLLQASAELTFTANASERGRFDTSGNFLCGGTFYGQDDSFSVTANGEILVARASGAGRTMASFKNGGTSVGSITTTTTATTYNTSSDARLKDVTGEARGLEVITKLNPVAYNWKADGKADEGLIAQEVKELVPNAVTGSEDEHYQMDYSKLVTHLVKAVQELEQQTIELKKEIANLKGE